MLFGMIPCAILWMRYEERRAAEIDRQLDLGLGAGAVHRPGDPLPPSPD